MNNQLNIFGTDKRTSVNDTEKIGRIKDLSIVEDFISEVEEKELREFIDKEEWLNDLSRRVQHYGYKYDYRFRRIDLSMKIGDLPIWIEPITERLVEKNYFKTKPDQLIVNEYEIGQGISPHIDCEPCFDDTIVSISLNSTAIMNFNHAITNEKIEIFLPRRSAVILKGESRYNWKHSIPGRKTDKLNNQIMKRGRRISLTFRRVII